MDYGQAFFLYTAAIKIFDGLTLVGIWYACWYLRFDSNWFPAVKGQPNFHEYSRIALPLLGVFSVMFHVVGAYRKDRIHFGFRALKKVVEGSILGTLVFISICYFLYEVNYSRLYLAIFPFLAIIGLLIERAILQGIWNGLERTLVKKIRILLLGAGELLEMYVSKIENRRPYPLTWVGRLGEIEPQTVPPVAEVSNHGPNYLSHVPHLGTEENLHQVLEKYDINLVVVAYPTQQASRYQPILTALSNELVGVKVLPDFGKYSTFTYSAEHECGIPLLVFNQHPTGATDRALKRLFDILGSLAFMMVFSPLYLLIALLVKLTSKGPIIYSQKRVGADGAIFDVYKFRSMPVDAEAETGAIWASASDDRATPLGKWLRRSSLDELPQFFNVLRGDMSLVGPRSERPVFVKQFKQEVPKYMLRHMMKSGITGWAQVNGWRGNTSLEERVKHDLFYIGHWSHFFDIKILLMTPFVVIKDCISRHAY